MISSLLGILLGQYFLLKRIPFISTGAYTQIVESQTEFQADLSYSFSGNKEATDLCIEIVVTSGNVKKLRKYQLRNILEVWFWVEEKITVYGLQGDDYVQLKKSLCLPDLDLNHLKQCLLMDSQLDAMLAFKEKYE
jgi:Uma2 family endonuclease